MYMSRIICPTGERAVEIRLADRSRMTADSNSGTASPGHPGQVEQSVFLPRLPSSVKPVLNVHGVEDLA